MVDQGFNFRYLLKKNGQQKSFCWPFLFLLGLSKINDVF